MAAYCASGCCATALIFLAMGDEFTDPLAVLEPETKKAKTSKSDIAEPSTPVKGDAEPFTPGKASASSGDTPSRRTPIYADPSKKKPKPGDARAEPVRVIECESRLSANYRKVFNGILNGCQLWEIV